MGEKRYLIADFYGYGKCTYCTSGYDRPHYFFDNSSWVGELTAEPPFKKIHIFNSRYNYDVPLFLVEEDGIWREYFTGRKINYYDFSYREKDRLIIRELVFGNRYGGATGFSTPKEFADAISKFSEEEKESMARQFLQLQRDAAAWSRSYDMLPERKKQMELEKERANKQAAEELEYGMGQYNNVTPEVSQARGGCLTQILMVLAGVLSVCWLLFQ